MADWVNNTYMWLGEYSEASLIDELGEYLSYMCEEGPIYGHNYRNLKSRPFIEWLVGTWGGRYVKAS
jgi:hypothetical protein